MVIVPAVGLVAAAAIAAPSGPELVANVGQRAERVAPPPRQVSVIAGGDILTEFRVRSVAARYGDDIGARFEFGPMFAPVRPVVASADVAICHMELPIGTAGGAYGNSGRSPFGGNRLVAPYEITAGVLGAGFDRCSTASNHSYDVGNGGIATTLDALDAHGLGSTGTARAASGSNPSIFEVDGIRIGHVSFTTGSNTVSPAQSWRLNLSRDPSVIASHVDRVRRDGAQLVLVSLHVSQEMLTAPTHADRVLVTSLVQRSAVDAVFIHGPHVVQPLEVVGGTPVWWSLGNFVSEMGGPTAAGRYTDPRTGDGLLAFVRFTEQPDGTFRAEPAAVAICNDRIDRTVRPATAELARPNLPASIRADLQACLARTRSVVPDAH